MSEKTMNEKTMNEGADCLNHTNETEITARCDGTIPAGVEKYTAEYVSVLAVRLDGRSDIVLCREPDAACIGMGDRVLVSPNRDIYPKGTTFEGVCVFEPELVSTRTLGLFAQAAPEQFPLREIAARYHLERFE